MTSTQQTIPPAPAPRNHECGGLVSLRFDSEEGGRWSCESHSGPTLVISTRGRVEVSGRGMGRCSVRRGRMTLLPGGADYRLRAYGKTRTLVCRFDAVSVSMQPRFVAAGKLTAIPFSEEIRTVADLAEVLLRTDITVRNPESFDRKRLWLQELVRRQCLAAWPTLNSSFADLDAMLAYKRKAARMFEEALNSPAVQEMARDIARKII